MKLSIRLSAAAQIPSYQIISVTIITNAMLQDVTSILISSKILHKIAILIQIASGKLYSADVVLPY